MPDENRGHTDVGVKSSQPAPRAPVEGGGGGAGGGPVEKPAEAAATHTGVLPGTMKSKRKGEARRRTEVLWRKEVQRAAALLDLYNRALQLT